MPASRRHTPGSSANGLGGTDLAKVDVDVIEAMRASGPGWQIRANEAVKKRF